MSCSELSAHVGEPLAGTASRADHFVLLEVRGAWGRDPVTNSGLPEAIERRLTDWIDDTGAARVLFIRRPDRRTGPVALYRIDCTRAAATRLDLDRLDDLADVSLDADAPDGVPVESQLLLVCTHGRRDACCARLGVPVFDALCAATPPPAEIWHSSHHGGHRFAGNVLALPHGIQLGRIEAADVRSVATALADGRIPLAHYRGRSIHDAKVQAADAAVRAELALDRLTDVTATGVDGSAVLLDAAGRTISVVVTERPGEPTPPSCGEEPVDTVAYDTVIVGQSVR